MTTIYDPAQNHYKIEVNSMGHYTVTRPKAGSKYFDSDASESKYLQFEEDVEPLREGLNKMPFVLSNKRNQAYVDLINSQFE